jgi:hypothetical protein
MFAIMIFWTTMLDTKYLVALCASDVYDTFLFADIAFI